MSKIESYKPGDFCWAELATSDAAAAKKFYGEMFGWSTVDFPMPHGVYTMFQMEGAEVGGMYQAPPGVPTYWGVYFATTDVDASARQITALGGKIDMGPMDVGESGRMVTAEDPRGVHFALWQAKQHVGITYAGTLGKILWPEVYSRDAAATAAFYGALNGWKTKPETGLESAQYVEWVHHGSSMGGLLPMNGPEWTGVPEHWISYTLVADCAERVERAKALGAKVYVGPKEIPNTGIFAMIGDPQGAVFAIIQMTGMHQPTTA